MNTAYTRRGGLNDRPVFCELCQFYTGLPPPHNNKTPRLVIQAGRRPCAGLDDLHQLLSLDRLVGILPDAPPGINPFKQIHYCLPPIGNGSRHHESFRKSIELAAAGVTIYSVPDLIIK